MLHTLKWYSAVAAQAIKVYSKKRILNKFISSGDTESAREFVAYLIKDVAQRVSQAAGLTYFVEGLDNIPKDKAVVYCPNHTSALDILPILEFAPVTPGFVMKVEHAKIPGARTWLEKEGCVFVDRYDMRAAAGALKQARENLMNGISMVIFPEGTRTKNGALSDFRAGAFKIAQKTGAPLIPVAISGARELFEKDGNIKPGLIKISFLPPIEIGSMTRKEFKAVPDTVKEEIRKKLYETQN